MINLRLYILTLLCLIVRGGQIASFWEKKPLSLLYIKEPLSIYKRMTWKQPPHLKNLDNFPPGAFYSTPLTIRHKRVYGE